jgi:hypothetical protein
VETARLNTQFLQLTILIILTLFILNCGSSSDESEPSTQTVHGTWEGVTTTKSLGNVDTVFNFTQEGNNIVEGTLEWSHSNGTIVTDNITGTINDSTVTISALFPSTSNGTLEAGYEGSLSGSTYNGDISLFLDGNDTGDYGSFSLNKKDVAPVVPFPNDNPLLDCETMGWVCLINCFNEYELDSSEYGDCLSICDQIIKGCN